MTFLALFLASTMTMAKHPDAKAGEITKLSFTDGDKEFPYWLFVPKKSDGKAAPLILFLHGSGEREGGTKGPHEVGLPPAIPKFAEDFPFYVIIPRFGRRGSWKADGEDGKRAMAILEQVVKSHSIDEKRLYLTGLSMGGNGTWELATAYPDKWAAIRITRSTREWITIVGI
jgi:predicted peptidase